MPYPMTVIAAWLADLEDRAALAMHRSDQAAGRDGVALADLDEALDAVLLDTGDAQARSLNM